jgi:hypothetical protein
MTQSLATQLKNRLLIVWKLALSVRKRNWDLSDYPVEIWEWKHDPLYSGKRFRQERYGATILNWGVNGIGPTEADALRDLEANFARARAAKERNGLALPRPGIRVPVEFASRDRVDMHAELANDFIKRILGLEWAWISDESSLWDFHRDETNEALVSKIKEVYGIDISDIASANLSEILGRIAEHQQPAN